MPGNCHPRDPSWLCGATREAIAQFLLMVRFPARAPLLICLIWAGSAVALPNHDGSFEARGSRHPLPDDGLDCNGNLVLIRDTKSVLLRKCGPPLREERSCSPTVCTDLWLYQPDEGSFVRQVTLINDVVWGIVALPRLAL